MNEDLISVDQKLYAVQFDMKFAVRTLILSKVFYMVTKSGASCVIYIGIQIKHKAKKEDTKTEKPIHNL